MTEPTGVRAHDEETDTIVDLPRPLVIEVEHEGRKRILRIRMARGTLVKESEAA